MAGLSRQASTGESITGLSARAIAGNYRRVVERLGAAAHSVGRDPSEVNLLVVTKGHSLDVVRAAIQAGARLLGENYVEEAAAKIQAISPDQQVTWHMIGHVQSRKAQQVVDLFAWVQSVDSLKLASRLERFAAEAQRRLPILLECNVSGEETKYGWKAWDETGWPALADELAPIIDLPHLEVRGLMTMPPFSSDPEAARPYFQRLRRLQSMLMKHIPQASWTELSMGMSGDFEVAVQEGATIVRVGTAIVGERRP